MRNLFIRRFFRCVVCLILVCCLVVSWSPIRARAMAGGGIISGGIGAVGLGLTCGQVAILLLGALGVYYTVQNADALGAALEYALDEQLRIEEEKAAIVGQQTALLNSWWESAMAGVIELASAPAWIVDTVKSWAYGFL